jgi:hypothetical protein
LTVIFFSPIRKRRWKNGKEQLLNKIPEIGEFLLPLGQMRDGTDNIVTVRGKKYEDGVQAVGQHRGEGVATMHGNNDFR